MQDVTPPERSIRNIPVAHRRGAIPPAPPPMHHEHARQPGPRRFWLWAVITVVACAALGAGVALLFSGATVAVVARTASITPQGIGIAERDAKPGTLGYQLLSLSASSTQTVAATGTEEAHAAAQGTITIYNLTTASQPLIANTRFESADGHLYRIHATVIVPAGKKATDGTVTPGTIDTTAYADKEGPDYNSGPLQLSIPGFKGTPQYNNFYAKTSGMSGGASGPQPVVSAADKAQTQSVMESQLKDALSSQVASQVPAGYIIVPGTLAITYSPPVATPGASGSATLSESGTATAAIIKTADLASALAAGLVDGYSGQPVDLADPAHLPLSLATDTQYSPSTTSVHLAFGGPVVIVWQIDGNAIAQTLAGKPKSQFESIMATFKPAVAGATASLRPFWRSTFPSDPSKIKVNVTAAS